MKFMVTAVCMDRASRRARTDHGSIHQRDELINTETNQLFKHCETPLDVERTYEAFWNNIGVDSRNRVIHSKEVVKVINVEREI